VQLGGVSVFTTQTVPGEQSEFFEHSFEEQSLTSEIVTATSEALAATATLLLVRPGFNPHRACHALHDWSRFASDGSKDLSKSLLRAGEHRGERSAVEG
jgi:hypothetical protein